MSVAGTLFALPGRGALEHQDDLTRLDLICGILTTGVVLWTVVLGNTLEIGVDGVRVWQLLRRRFFPYRVIRRHSTTRSDLTQPHVPTAPGLGVKCRSAGRARV